MRWKFQKALDITVFQGGGDGRGYRNINMYKIAGGSKPNQPTDIYIYIYIYVSIYIYIYRHKNIYICVDIYVCDQTKKESVRRVMIMPLGGHKRDPWWPAGPRLSVSVCLSLSFFGG
jgi:hypothetical protein